MSSSNFHRTVRLDRGADGAQRDVEDELSFHFTRRVEELMAAGHSREDAERETTRAFGDVDEVRRELTRRTAMRATRRQRSDYWRDLAADARYAMRSLRRVPGYTTVALLTLAISIGAATAVFSVVNGVLLRPLPYPHPEQLVRVEELHTSGSAMNWAGANFLEARQRERTLSSMALYSDGPTTVLGAGDPMRTTLASTSREFFSVLGVRPMLGRTFAGDEGAVDTPPNVVVVSHSFWKRALDSDPDYSRHLLRVEGLALKVIGVMPEGFAFPAEAEAWVPFYDGNPSRTSHNWQGIGRLASGQSVGSAGSDLNAILKDIKQREGKESDAVGIYLRSLHEDLAASSRTGLLFLQGAVGFVLLLACVNLASAGLARSEGRIREMAVRAALGADRGRLVRQLITENLLLAIAGGAFGVLLARGLVKLALAAAPASLPRFASIDIDARVMVFALAASALTGLLIGLMPAWQGARADLRHAIGDGTRSTSRGGLGARRALIGAEAALAVTLLIGAGLLVRSLGALLTVPPGFDADRVLTATLALPPDVYSDTAKIVRYFDQLLPRLQGSASVTAAAVVSSPPLSLFDPTSSVSVDGATDFAGGAGYRVVSEDYFRTMGIPIISGRTFAQSDGLGQPHVAIISQEAAKRLLPNLDPMGHRVRFPGMDRHNKDWLTIVGVVGDIRQSGLDQPLAPEIYVSYRQRPERLVYGNTIAVRTSLDPASLGNSVRSIVRELDANVPVTLSSMRVAIDKSVAPRRFTANMLTSFSAIALFLAAIGIYGVLAYSVAQRRRELSVRMALGAEPTRLMHMVIGDAMRSVLPGMIVGGLAALALSRVMQKLVFGITTSDPLSYVVAAGSLLAVALLASYIPARRATRVDPALAMRGE